MTDPFLPPSDRRKILRQYGEMYALSIFVETGTSVGDTPYELYEDFEVLYTIEVGKEIYEAARNRFRSMPKIICLHGDSGVLLSRVVGEIGNTPALFWLDGHYSGGARADKDTPIMEELDTIFGSGVEHVVLIDDARLFEGMSHYGEHDWPHVNEVRAVAEGNGYDFECKDDIIRLTPRLGDDT